MSGAREFLDGLLRGRLPEASRAWLAEAQRSVEALAPGPGPSFATLLSQASRRIPRGDLAPTADELGRANEVLEGWNPERWTKLESARALLVLARSDLATPAGAAAIEEAFRYADMGEWCALYKVLALLPQPQRFVWRAGEGCRSSMKSVFESVACDNPLPVRHFDDVAWRQMLIKALFVEAPLERVFGLEARLDGETARMALDLADERRSAGRPVNPDSWRLVANFGGARGIASLERELASGTSAGKAAASAVLARLR